MKASDGIHETFEGDVQYPYADVGAPELMHISKITTENRKAYNYTCPYCKKILRPRLGMKRHHFAHRPGERCDQDKYIHSTAERLLKEKWDSDEPFTIIMKVRTECQNFDSCIFHRDYLKSCAFDIEKTFNLKEQYSQCLVEKKIGEFVPDLCLIDETGKHEPIFIEIWSKHKNSDKKVMSDYRIIEIRIKKLEELENLTVGPIIESPTVTFSHFKTLKQAPPEEAGPPLMRYILYANSLKCFVDDKKVNCGNYRNTHQAKSLMEVVCSKDEIFTIQEFRNYCNALAIERGYDIRLCFICQQYGEDRRNNRDFFGEDTTNTTVLGCKRELSTQGIIPCKIEDAKTCDYFIIKDVAMRRVKTRYFNINRYIWINNADGTISEEFQRHNDILYESMF